MGDAKSVVDNDSQIPLQNLESGAPTHWRIVFNKYDQDGDGQISVQEFANALKKEHYNKDVPKRVVNKILCRADINNDGYITYTEFLDMIRTRDGYELLTGWFHTYVHHTVVPRDHKTVHIDALDGEYEDEYSCFPPPVGMIIISIIEVATFLYDYLNTGDSHSVNGPSASVLIYDPHRRKEAWRFLCYMLVHVGWLHLILNLIIQVALGIPLEMVHGWWRIFIVYSAGVILGSLGTSVADPNVFLAGASGGVYALITAHLATLIMNWSEMQFAWVQLIIFVIVCGTDIGSNVYNFVHSVDTNIGHAAHLGGAVAGLLVGLFVLRNLEVRSWEKKICLVAVVIYSILMIGAIVLHISAPGYFPYQSV